MPSLRTGLVLLAVSAAPALAQTQVHRGGMLAMPEVKATRTQQGIDIDGKLDEQAWRAATVISGFLQRDPTQGATPTEKTEVLLLYDDEGIYVGARMLDTHPDSIVGRLTRRDAQTNSDRFMVFIDSYHDKRTGFYFGINAAGTLYDGTLLNDDWDDNTWDGVWTARSALTSEGWTAEIRIPYSQLRFQAGSSIVWGINFKREIARLNETDYLVYTPRNESGFVSRFPDLGGLDQVKPPRRMELLPYVTSRAEFSTQDPGNPFNDGSHFDGNAGLDAKMGIGSNMTLDATINPDFGQVEVDPAVVNLSDVETFFPEKRPFFIEGANIFTFGEGGANNFWGFNWGNPIFFYSRRIGRAPQGAVPDTATYSDSPAGTTILGAAKLSGRFGGGWSVGMLSAVTDREHGQYEISNGQRGTTEIEPLTYYGVLRTQREFGKGAQGVGIMSTFTARDLQDPVLADQINQNALGLGLDGWTFLDRGRTWVITGWSGYSRVSGTTTRMTDLQRSSLHYFQRPDAGYKSVDSNATSLSGYAGRILLNKQKGKWQVNAAFAVVDPGYDVNDLGFQFKSDIINYHAVLERRWPDPGKLFRNLNMNLAAFQSQNFSGDPTWRGFFQNANAQFLNYTGAYYFVAFNPQAWDDRLTRGGPTAVNPMGFEGELGINSDDRKSIILNAWAHGSHYDYRADRSYTFGGGIEWRPASAVSFKFEPRYERRSASAQYVATFDDVTAAKTFGQRYVFGDLDQSTVSADIRVNWTFTPRLSLELYTQPLFSSGDYTHFKEFAQARTFNFNEYGTGASTINGTTNSDGDIESYTVDPDGAGAAAPFSFDNPDFGFASLRGNAVLRWEFLPGSTVYLVWNQSRSESDLDPSFGMHHAFDRLGSAAGDNIFAVKVSYWWNP